MPTKSRAKSFFNNLLYAFAAQGISLILSFLMSLIVPKILGVTEFGYWQLFIFYSSYVGFFHFGLNDGIYLRYGGNRYGDLNYSLLGSQFWVSVAAQIIMAAGATLYAFCFIEDVSRRYVLIMASAYLVIFNACLYIGYIFQAVNHTRIFSFSVMIDKVFFIITVILLLLIKEKRFETFIVLYLIGKSLCLVYCLHMGRRIVFTHLLPLRVTIREMGVNISVGINLMFSNIAGLLILGVGRFITDEIWGVEAFGKISLSLALANFFLLFISQISMVLFPALRQADPDRQHQFYEVGRDFLGIALAGVFLVYLPIKVVLGLWLPQYRDSLEYLALLLPICTFDGKMQMLCSTYLKVLRKEKVLLIINLLTLALSLILCFIGGYLLHSVNAIVLFMVAAVAFRSILSDIYLSRMMRVTVVKSMAAEVALAALFVVCTWYLSALWGFIIYFIAYSFYLLLSRDKLKKILYFAKRFLKPQ